MIEEFDLFSYSTPRFHIGDKEIRLIEMFAGIGSQYAALKRLNCNVTPWRCIEWDKYCIMSYNAVHGTNFEPSDIQKIHAEDLGIAERERNTVTYLHTLFPVRIFQELGEVPDSVRAATLDQDYCGKSRESLMSATEIFLKCC